MGSRRGKGQADGGLKVPATAQPPAPPPSRKAAGDFLSAWVTQPVEEPWPRDAGFRERIRLFASLADVPVTGVPVMSQSVAERAAQRR